MSAAEQRRLLAELMGSADAGIQQPEKNGNNEEASRSGHDSRSDSPEKCNEREFDADSIYGNHEREFDADSIYGDHGDERGGRSGADDNSNAKTANASGLPEGYGPPMANIIVFGMPWSKDNRAAVKAKLRGEAAQHGEVLSLTWGSRKGTCFLSMASPLDASKVIVKMNEKSFLLPGHGTKLLKFKLDRDQGHVRPDPEELRGEHQNEPRFAGGHMDEEMMPPVSFTSRQGKMDEKQEVEREKRWLVDTMCWCSICDSREHTEKSCSVDVPQYHERVALGYIPAGAPVDDQGLIFGPLPPEFETTKQQAAAAEETAAAALAQQQVQEALGKYPMLAAIQKQALQGAATAGAAASTVPKATVPPVAAPAAVAPKLAPVPSAVAKKPSSFSDAPPYPAHPSSKPYAAPPSSTFPSSSSSSSHPRSVPPPRHHSPLPPPRPSSHSSSSQSWDSRNDCRSSSSAHHPRGDYSHSRNDYPSDRRRFSGSNGSNFSHQKRSAPPSEDYGSNYERPRPRPSGGSNWDNNSRYDPRRRY